VIVKVEVIVPFAAGVTETGANVQLIVADTGAIAQVNPTAELNPFTDVTVIVDAVVFPAVVIAAAGAALIV
jgi:hypothetical protein